MPPSLLTIKYNVTRESIRKERKSNMLTILAVDADPKLLALVIVELTKAGYNVIKAANGEEALDETVDDLPDLAVVDVMMPKMDGFTLTKHLREMDLPFL